MDEGMAGRATAPLEQRRSSRFRVVVPIEAKWQDSSGNNVTVTAEAKEVNALGGLLDMKKYPGVGSRLELTNLLSNEAAQARVAAVRRSKAGGVLGIAIELLSPSEDFWGVNFQLKRASAQLARIEQTIQSGGVDSRILQEFRDAVDYVRKTAWAVYEWQERQLKKHDPNTVFPLITSERIRRATQLTKSISTDLAAHQVTRESEGIDEFFRAIETLHQQIADLLKSRQA